MLVVSTKILIFTDLYTKRRKTYVFQEYERERICFILTLHH